MKQEFKEYLQNYLRDHDFDTEDVLSQFVEDCAETAADCYHDHIKAGGDGVGAREVAIQSLFADVGLSRKEASRNILEDYFASRLAGKDLEEWALKLSEQDSILNDFLLECGLGLDENLVESRNAELRNLTDQFLTSNGL